MPRALVTLVLALGSWGVASADVISMAEEDCIDKTAGAACEGEDGRGTCQTGECCRLDYSQMPPQQACQACLVCTPGSGGDDDDDGCDAAAAGGPVGPAAVGLGIALMLRLRRRRR